MKIINTLRDLSGCFHIYIIAGRKRERERETLVEFYYIHIVGCKDKIEERYTERERGNNV